MADSVTTPFIMHGAREAINNGMTHIEEQVKAIELAVNENPGLAFDLAKALVESTCRTILKERRVDFQPDDDLPNLFKATTGNLPFLPAGVSDAAEVRRSLAQTIGGLNTTMQGICELRNKCGFASHGSEGPRPALESIQAMLAAESADAMVGFLYRLHRSSAEATENVNIDYGTNENFNKFIDDAHDIVQIFNEEFLPSRIFFEMAPEPYRIYLADFVAERNEEEGASANTVDNQP